MRRRCQAVHMGFIHDTIKGWCGAMGSSSDSKSVSRVRTPSKALVVSLNKKSTLIDLNCMFPGTDPSVIHN